MGGWYDFDRFVHGHALGQFISRLSHIGASTGEEAAHDKVRALIYGFAETLGPNITSILRPETNDWICYTLDKHFIDLMDGATLSNVTDAIPLLSRVLDGALLIMPAVGHDRVGVHNLLYDELFVMPKNLYTVVGLTNNPTFTDHAQRYLINSAFSDVLASGGGPSLRPACLRGTALHLAQGAMAYIVSGDTTYWSVLNQGSNPLLLSKNMQAVDTD
jgi:uncharacterized protein